MIDNKIIFLLTYPGIIAVLATAIEPGNNVTRYVWNEADSIMQMIGFTSPGRLLC